MVDLLADWLPGCLGNVLFGIGLAGWLASWLAGWMASWQVGCSFFDITGGGGGDGEGDCWWLVAGE